MKNIQFGTSGHRGIVGEAFSVRHVRAIARAVAVYLKQSAASPALVIGYDPRGGNSASLEEGSFTRAAVEVLTHEGVLVYFLDEPAPTPLVSWFIKQAGLDGGLILTASHNPPEYNGIKFNDSFGAPAPAEVTQGIETLANQFYEEDCVSVLNPDFCHEINATAAFSEALLSTVGAWGKLSGLKACVDVKHGTTGAVWAEIGKSSDLEALCLHADPKSDFGGVEPNPTKPIALAELRAFQKHLQAPLGVAHDPDGDRHVLLDEHGDMVTPEQTSVIIGHYLLSRQIPVWGMVTTVASSRIVRQFAVQNSLHFEETQVGFKYFSPYFQLGQSLGQIVIGVESSGGLSVSAHTMEKCGFFPAVMMAMIMSETGKTVAVLKAEALSHYGKSVFLEEEMSLTETSKQGWASLIRDPDIRTLRDSFKGAIDEINQKDGLKVRLTNQDWVLVRLSGTEPVARIYAESSTKEDASELIQALKQWASLNL